MDSWKHIEADEAAAEARERAYDPRTAAEQAAAARRARLLGLLFLSACVLFWVAAFVWSLAHPDPGAPRRPLWPIP